MTNTMALFDFGWHFIPWAYLGKELRLGVSKAIIVN